VIDLLWCKTQAHLRAYNAHDLGLGSKAGSIEAVDKDGWGINLMALDGGMMVVERESARRAVTKPSQLGFIT
jgi:hypothetical protein